MLLVDLFAYMGDVVSYYQDRIASESFLDTAVERRSILNLLRLIGYELAPPVAASAELTLVFNPPGPGEPTTVTVPAGAAFATTAGTTPAQTFVYLGDDRTIDLAGPEVTAGADGKLSFAGLPVRHGRQVAERDPRLVDGRAEPGVPARVEPGRARHARRAGRRGRRARSTWEPAHEPPLPRRPRRAASSPRDANATDYYVQFDEDGRASVVFGDGEYGRSRRSGATRCAPRTSPAAARSATSPPARSSRRRRRSTGSRASPTRCRPRAGPTPSRSTAPSASGRSRSGRATAP